MIDLEAIFGDGPEAAMGSAPWPQSSDNAPASEQAADSFTASPDASKAVPTPETPPAEPDGGADPFAGWVLRPDIDGRMGWEPPNLPEANRWWARATFEDLPRLADVLPDAAPGSRPCCWCGRREWWRSKAWPDLVRCGWCSPPAPGVQVEWLNKPVSAQLEQTNRRSARPSLRLAG
jgi:hypothetical protein